MSEVIMVSKDFEKYQIMNKQLINCKTCYGKIKSQIRLDQTNYDCSFNNFFTLQLDFYFENECDKYIFSSKFLFTTSAPYSLKPSYRPHWRTTYFIHTTTDDYFHKIFLLFTVPITSFLLVHKYFTELKDRKQCCFNGNLLKY